MLIYIINNSITGQILQFFVIFAGNYQIKSLYEEC